MYTYSNLVVENRALCSVTRHCAQCPISYSARNIYIFNVKKNHFVSWFDITFLNFFNKIVMARYKIIIIYVILRMDVRMEPLYFNNIFLLKYRYDFSRLCYQFISLFCTNKTFINLFIIMFQKTIICIFYLNQ